MICRTCGTSNFIQVNKKISQRDSKNDSVICLLVCNTCDPITSSLKNINNGFETGCKILGLQNNTKLSKIIKAYEKFGLDKNKLTYKEDNDFIRCKGSFINGEQFEVSVRKY